MARYGMLINTKKCIGCYACRVACQRQNNLLPTEDFIRYEEHEVGTYPNVRVETVPLQCMHCEDAPCVAVCPTGAAYIGADGIVGVEPRPLHRLFVSAWRRAPTRCACATRRRARWTSACSARCRRDDGHEDVLVRGGLPDGGAYVRRSGRPGQRHLEGDRRDERAAYRGRPDQVQSILREVMNDDV